MRAHLAHRFKCADLKRKVLVHRVLCWCHGMNTTTTRHEALYVAVSQHHQLL